MTDAPYHAPGRVMPGWIIKLTTFEKACDDASRAAKRRPVERTLFLRRLLSDDVSLEAAWHQINARRERERQTRA
jgi:hypothetical protein